MSNSWVGDVSPLDGQVFTAISGNHCEFIELEEGIDGLVHLSDLSWNVAGEEAIRNFKKGDEVEAVVLGIDVEKERISLGIKQMEGDPYTNFIATHEKNSLVRGSVKSVDARGAVIALNDDVEGYLRASEAATHRIERYIFFASLANLISRSGFLAHTETVCKCLHRQGAAGQRVPAPGMPLPEDKRRA